MMYVGNDIVSMKLNENKERYLSKRFLDKLFTPSEQEFLWSTGMPDYALWLLWAAKEGAYKIYNKQSGKRMYYPKKFEVKVDDKQLLPYIESAELHASKTNQPIQANPPLVLHGTVSTPLKNVSVSFFPSYNFIYALAAENNGCLNNIRWGILSISTEEYKEQSFCVRQIAKQRIAKEFDINSSSLEIIRHRRNGQTGPPGIYCDGRKIQTDISLTHDADLVAYAYL